MRLAWDAQVVPSVVKDWSIWVIYPSSFSHYMALGPFWVDVRVGLSRDLHRETAQASALERTANTSRARRSSTNGRLVHTVNYRHKPGHR